MTTSHVIKISANCFREFHAMIDTCANDLEDETWFGLWTALDNATNTSKGYQTPKLATLNENQIIKLKQWVDDQAFYLQDVTIPQCNDDRDYAGANGCRYTIKGLRDLYRKLDALINPDTPSE